MTQNLVIGLDLTPVDEVILQAVKSLPVADEIRRIYLVHVMRDLSMPDNLAASFQKFFAPEQPLDERMENEMAQTAREVLGELPGVTLSVDVVEGHPQKKLLEWVELKNADLLVLGKKKVATAGGVVARRIASQSSCNTLFVPYNWERKMENILVPVDFSDNSARAVEQALLWKEKQPQLRITALHLADYLPSGYYMNIKDQNRFNELVRTAAEEAFEEFFHRGKFDGSQIERVILGEEDGNIPERIIEFANLRKMDAIIVGARGHSALQRFLFGSVTERLLSYAFRQMVFIVR